MTPSFLWGHKAERVREAIANSGCRIRALFHLPGGSLRATGIDTYLVVLERGQQQDVFIGQYNEDVAHQEQLIANFRRTKLGSHPALGRLCALADFKGFEAFAARDRLKRLARAAGWLPVPASEVFTAHEMIREQHLGALPHGPTSCYLRLAGGRPVAALDVEALRAAGRRSARDVVHLQIAPSVADPRFMVHWFNTSPTGRATLATISRGGVMPRVDLSGLLDDTVFYLPVLRKQMVAIDAGARLARIRSQADELEISLWDGSGDVDSVASEIDMINLERRFEDWIETLPFPLASILWRHRAGGGSAFERYGVLLHFFEATAAFLATVHLSAFMADDALWKEHAGPLKLRLVEQGHSLDRATFGSWKLINEYLSSACNRLLKDPSRTELWHRIYGTPNEGLLSALCCSELRALLQAANQIRNNWNGHAGAVGDEKAHQIHDELSVLVDRLRGIFGRRWLAFTLIQPGLSAYTAGIHRYKAKRVMGTRSAPFEDMAVESVQPLEHGDLHLFDAMSRTSLRLQPFIRVMPSPEQRVNACFIFSRRQGSGFRFVSYHFEAESEVSDAFLDVEATLGRLYRFDDESTE